MSRAASSLRAPRPAEQGDDDARLAGSGQTTPMMLSVALSLVLGAIGIVIWLEGGPHPRTWHAWFLLGVILIVTALPVLFCQLFC